MPGTPTRSDERSVRWAQLRVACWASSSSRLREMSCFRLWRVVKLISQGAIEPALSSALSSSQSLDFLFGLAALTDRVSKIIRTRSSSMIPDAVAGCRAAASMAARSLPLSRFDSSIVVSSEASELVRLGDGPSGAHAAFDGDMATRAWRAPSAQPRRARELRPPLKRKRRPACQLSNLDDGPSFGN